MGTFRGSSFVHQSGVKTAIKAMGGQLMAKAQANRFLKSHTKTPQLFILMNNDEELMKATAEDADTREDDGEEAGTGDSADEDGGNGTDTSDCSTSSGPAAKRSRLSNKKDEGAPILTKVAIHCRRYAGGDFTFLKIDYLNDMRTSEVVLDPYSSTYMMKPGPNVKKIKVIDIKPLFQAQCDPDANGSRTSAIVAVKRHRKALAKQCRQQAPL